MLNLEKLHNKFYEAYNNEEWHKAIKFMDAIIAKEDEPSFFCYSSLSSCYYELKDYQTALEYSIKAYNINPYSPLVLWDYAGVLIMLEKESKAIEFLKKIQKMGEYSIGYKITTEGAKWARSLINDSNFLIGKAYYQICKDALAKKYLLRHLSNRKKGLYSRYTKKMVVKYLNKLND